MNFGTGSAFPKGPESTFLKVWGRIRVWVCFIKYANNFHMRKETFFNLTKFEVLKSLCKLQIFFKWDLWVMLFHGKEYGDGKMPFKMILEEPFSQCQWILDIKSILNLNCWGNIINLLVYQKAIQMLWEYLQKLLKPVPECLKQEG